MQARLTIANASDSWLSEMFAVEYAILFDIFNPGLAALRLPIALGGTSNHFRAAALRSAGGWDAWNVTEDADLGIRMARFGMRVESLNSETLEEAPHEFGNWLRQRVRWQKGWMQTLIVHSRTPFETSRQLGGWGAASALALFAGGLSGGLFGTIFFFDTFVRLHFGRAGPRLFGPLVRRYRHHRAAAVGAADPRRADRARHAPSRHAGRPWRVAHHADLFRAHLAGELVCAVRADLPALPLGQDRSRSRKGPPGHSPGRAPSAAAGAQAPPLTSGVDRGRR